MDLNDIVDSPARRMVFDAFLEEACRQWCDFIDDEPERVTGEGFAGFFYEIFEMKEEEMLEDVNAQINACVMATIGGDRANLPVKAVTSECLKQELEHYRESGARAEAVRQLMAGRADTSFLSRYHADHWTENDMTAYLEDPDEYIQARAEDYIMSNGEELLVQFLKLDALAAELIQIMNSQTAPYSLA